MSEQGHALNVAHFQELTSRVTAFGAPYDPSNLDITLAKLTLKLTAANTAMDAVIAKNAAEDTALTDRENLFAPLGPKVTRTVNYYASTGAQKNKVEDAKEFKRKIDGKRASPKVVDDPSTPGDESKKSISASQQSFTQKVEHLDGLIGVYKSDPLYVPNEADLKITALDAYSTSLKDANTTMIDALTDTSNARLTRNNVMYHPDSGMCELASLVKKYVKALFGATSPEFKQISGLEFRLQKS